MVSPDAKIILLSRTDGDRGPLGVAKEVNSRLVGRHECIVVEVVGGMGLLKALLRIVFKVRGYSVCIHANGYRIPLLLYITSIVNRTNRYYCAVHGIINIEKEYRPVVERDTKLEPFIFRRFQNIICVSQFERRKLFKLYGPRKNVSVIYNGVNPISHSAKCKAVDLALGEPVCITTGGFEQCKAVDLALKTLLALSKRGCKPKLIVCGRDSLETGSNRQLCEELASNGGVELVYEGEIRDSAILSGLYEMAHFYIGLSRFDTFNCSVLEGAAAGCVPVVSASCGASELFDNDSSICADINEQGFEQIIADQMYELIKNKDSYTKMSSNAVRVTELNTWDTVASNYWELLANA